MFKKHVLDNGIRIVCDPIPYVRSVSIGIWVGTGSRNEDRANNGISHFIEHMLFKGTQKRSAKDIARSIDNIGGQINAFTGKECTCFYAKTLDAHIDIALDVLSDMFFNSRFAQKDIDTERRVIIEEIGMYEDSPEELVHDVLSETVWDGNPLGYPILGTQESIAGFDRDMIGNYIDRNYVPANTVIAIAGNYDESRLIDMICAKFGGWKSKTDMSEGYMPVVFRPDTRIKQKDTEQAHVCIGFEGVEHGNDDVYPLLAMNNIFGGGMSSRLFQKIREDKGLVYSIYSYPSSYINAGLYTIYAGMNPSHVKKVMELIVTEIRKLVKNGISQKDLAKSKEQLKGSFILGLESTSSRMNSIGKSELLTGRIDTPDEVLKKIDAITMDDVRDVTARIFDMKKVSFSAVGSLKDGLDLQDFTPA